MTCRKGVWKFDALWEHPLGKGEATCHSSWLNSVCTEDSWKATARVHRHGRLVENTLLIAEGILYVTNLYHNILLVFGLIIFLTSQDDVIDQVNPDCGVLISSTSYSGFDLSLVQLIA